MSLKLSIAINLFKNKKYEKGSLCHKREAQRGKEHKTRNERENNKNCNKSFLLTFAAIKGNVVRKYCFIYATIFFLIEAYKLIAFFIH